jgi:hypothetical protein
MENDSIPLDFRILQLFPLPPILSRLPELTDYNGWEVWVNSEKYSEKTGL